MFAKRNKDINLNRSINPLIIKDNNNKDNNNKDNNNKDNNNKDLKLQQYLKY